MVLIPLPAAGGTPDMTLYGTPGSFHGTWATFRKINLRLQTFGTTIIYYLFYLGLPAGQNCKTLRLLVALIMRKPMRSAFTT